MKAFIFERNGEPIDVLDIRDLPDSAGPRRGSCAHTSVVQPTFTCPVDVSDVSPRRL